MEDLERGIAPGPPEALLNLPGYKTAAFFVGVNQGKYRIHGKVNNFKT